MARLTDEERQKAASEKLGAGIAKLRAGKHASAWVCREVLCLVGVINMADVLTKLQLQLNNAAKMERMGDRTACGLMATMAACTLLREMAK